jgi:hypothetical protein
MDHTKYLECDTIPEGFKVLDPSKMTKAMISKLWRHWTARTVAEKPILIFIDAQKQDFDQFALREGRVPVPAQKGPERVYPESVNLLSDDQVSGPDDDAGISKSPVGLPPSKRPRHLLAIPHKESPSANNSDRPKFLRSLCNDKAYLKLVARVLALPASVSLFFSYICMDVSNYSYK